MNKDTLADIMLPDRKVRVLITSPSSIRGRNICWEAVEIPIFPLEMTVADAIRKGEEVMVFDRGE